MTDWDEVMKATRELCEAWYECGQRDNPEKSYKAGRTQAARAAKRLYRLLGARLSEEEIAWLSDKWTDKAGQPH